MRSFTKEKQEQETEETKVSRGAEDYRVKKTCYTQSVTSYLTLCFSVSAKYFVSAWWWPKTLYKCCKLIREQMLPLFTASSGSSWCTQRRRVKHSSPLHSTHCGKICYFVQPYITFLGIIFLLFWKRKTTALQDCSMCNSFPPKLELAIAIHIVLDSIGHIVLKKEFLNNSAYFDPECSINSRAAWMISRRDSLLTI